MQHSCESKEGGGCREIQIQRLIYLEDNSIWISLCPVFICSIACWFLFVGFP